MHRLLAVAAASGLLAVAASGPARAAGPDLSVTQHSLNIGGRALAYTAEAGRLPLVDPATGKTRAYVYFVAYRLPAKAGAARPLTFLWNGGPGSNSAPLHLEAFGPRRLNEAGALEDNDATLLEASDLVFFDPVGTGYSRPADEAAAQAFYGTLGDIAAAADFVRAYETAHPGPERPLYLAGESFGVWRAAGAAEALETRGRHVAGVVLISGGMGLGKISPREATTALRLPNWTAAALWRHKLDASVGTDVEAATAASRAWAEGTYEPALLKRDSLTAAERDEVARGLAYWSGLPETMVDRQSLTVSPRQYLTGLLKAEGKTLQSLDMRLTTDVREPDTTGAIAGYMTGELGYRTGLAYVGLGQAYAEGVKPVSARWSYDSAPITPEAMAAAQAGEGPPGTQPWIQRAWKIDPKLRVFVAAGRYDSLNSCAGNEDTLRRIEPALAAQFTARCYAGGHMMYRDAPARRALTTDLKTFLSGR